MRFKKTFLAQKGKVCWGCAGEQERGLPVFLGYRCARGAAERASSLLASGQLPLLLDLDETLLVAATVNKFCKLIHDASKELASLELEIGDRQGLRRSVLTFRLVIVNIGIVRNSCSESSNNSAD